MLRPRIKQATNLRSDMLLVAEQEELRTVRANFSDEVKAKVFARDRATCGLSGINLWLLEEGACGFYASTEIDHIQPASKGGDDSEDNGISTHWLYNRIKRDDVQAVYLFAGGMPTLNFFKFHRQLSSEMASRLADYAEMHPSDWYFNSAVTSLLAGVSWLYEGQDKGYSRNDESRATTALRRIKQWKKIVDEQDVPSIEERGLVLNPPLADQKLLLSLREKSSVEEIRDLMKEVLPYHSANVSMVRAFNAEYDRYLDGEEIDFASVWEFIDNPYVSDDTLGRMLINMRLLADPYADLSKLSEPLSDEELDTMVNKMVGDE